MRRMNAEKIAQRCFWVSRKLFSTTERVKIVVGCWLPPPSPPPLFIFYLGTGKKKTAPPYLSYLFNVGNRKNQETTRVAPEVTDMFW